MPVNHADAIRTMAKVLKQDAATKSNIEIYNPSRASRFFQHMFAISSRSVTRILNAESGIAEDEEEDEEHHTHVTKDAIDRIRPTIIDMVQKKMPLDLTCLFETLQAHHGWVTRCHGAPTSASRSDVGTAAMTVSTRISPTASAAKTTYFG